MKIGQKIRDLRIAKGMSQGQLAEIIGVVPATISSYERYNSQPNLEKLKLLSKALCVSIDELSMKQSTEKADFEDQTVSNLEKMIAVQDQLIYYLKKRIVELEESSAKKDGTINKSAV